MCYVQGLPTCLADFRIAISFGAKHASVYCRFTPTSGKSVDAMHTDVLTHKPESYSYRFERGYLSTNEMRRIITEMDIYSTESARGECIHLIQSYWDLRFSFIFGLIGSKGIIHTEQTPSNSQNDGKKKNHSGRIIVVWRSFGENILQWKKSAEGLLKAASEPTIYFTYLVY